MWVEPDTNMPTGESFVRQLLYGQRYFEQMFGARHTVCWLPDCFGFSPALPQLLRLAGIDQLLHHQGELVRDQRDALRPLLVGGPRRHAASSPTPSTTRSAATTPRPAPAPCSRPGRTSAASTPARRACSPSATATAAAARPRRCSTASASSPTSPSSRRLRPIKVADWFADIRAAVADDADAAGLGRRDVPRAPPRHADHAGPDQIPAPPRRARADHRRDAVAAMATLLGDPSRRRRWSRTGASSCATSSTTSSPAPASARSTRTPRSELAAVIAAGDAVTEGSLAAIAARVVPGRATAPAVLVVNPDLSPRPLRLSSPDALPGGPAGRRRQRRSPGGRRSPASPPRGRSPTSRRPASRSATAGWRTTSCASRSPRRRHPRPASSTSAPSREALAGPRQPDLGLRRQAAQLGRLGHRGQLRRRRARRSPAPADRDRRARPAPRRDPRRRAGSATARIMQTYRLWAELRPARYRHRHRLARARVSC